MTELCGLARVTEEVTPEPMPVMQSYERCPKHNFRFISMPRDAREGYHGQLEKCPLKSCKQGR